MTKQLLNASTVSLTGVSSIAIQGHCTVSLTLTGVSSIAPQGHCTISLTGVFFTSPQSHCTAYVLVCHFWILFNIKCIDTKY